MAQKRARVRRQANNAAARADNSRQVLMALCATRQRQNLRHYGWRTKNESLNKRGRAGRAHQRRRKMTAIRRRKEERKPAASGRVGGMVQRHEAAGMACKQAATLLRRIKTGIMALPRSAAWRNLALALAHRDNKMPAFAQSLAATARRAISGIRTGIVCIAERVGRRTDARRLDNACAGENGVICKHGRRRSMGEEAYWRWQMRLIAPASQRKSTQQVINGGGEKNPSSKKA